MRRSRRRRLAGPALLVGLLAILVYWPAIVSTAGNSQPEAYLPPNFQDELIFGGLTAPTSVTFAPDGRIFVTEQSGIIKVFDNLDDGDAAIFADLTTEVESYWDRGLMGLALDPGFPRRPYVYVIYTLDAPIGGRPPVWHDGCSRGPTTTGCVVGARLSRLTAGANHVVPGSEKILIEDWCQQFPSHTIDHIAFGPDGKLYVSAGEGAAFDAVLDYGQLGKPPNPCGDPPAGPGRAPRRATAQGGALRSQSPRRPDGQPRTLSGSLIRVDPRSGRGASGNPFIASRDQDAKRIIAYGLRNPFRFTFRPGTNEIWLGDVDWYAYEQIELVADATDNVAENFGWPCYQGPELQPGFYQLHLDACRELRQSDVTFPYYSYASQREVVPGDGCGTERSSISGLAFYEGDRYPEMYRGALFFGDYSRACIWVMLPGADGRPNPATTSLFLRIPEPAGTNAGGPVDLEIGPRGDLFYVDYLNGGLHRIRHFKGNEPPIAMATASPTFGPLPLTVTFTGSASTDPDHGDSLSYAWDLDGDGAFDDSHKPNTHFTYNNPGRVEARLKVTDNHGLSTVSPSVIVSPGNTPPSPTIFVPARFVTKGWAVGNVVRFTVSVPDKEDPGHVVAAPNVRWNLILHHCKTSTACHEHLIFQGFAGYTGSFVAPAHEYPSYLELHVSATDSGGLTAERSLVLRPRKVTATFTTAPEGLRLVIAGKQVRAPYQLDMIAGATVSVIAPSSQRSRGLRYTFKSWSDGQPRSHTVAVNSNTTFQARYESP